MIRNFLKSSGHRLKGHTTHLAIITIAVLSFLLYEPALTATFGILDDYAFLFVASPSLTLTKVLWPSGRPLNGLLYDIVFYSAGTVDNLQYLRLMTLLGLWAMSGLIYFFSWRHGLSRAASGLLAFGAMLLPSSQVYMGWAQHFTTPIAGIFGLLAGYFISPVCGLRSVSRLYAIAISAALFLLAIIIYQPIAMLFVIAVMMSVILHETSGQAWSRSRLGDAIFVYVVGLGVGYLMVKVGLLIRTPHDSTRFAVTTEYLDKIVWFFSDPMRHALSLYWIQSSRLLSVGVGLYIAVGLAIAQTGKRSFRRFFIAFVVVLPLFLVASYAPNLLARESIATHRSLGAIYIGVLFLCVFASTSIMKCVERSLPRAHIIFAGLIFALAGSVLVFSRHTFVEGLIGPNVGQYENIRSHLRGYKEVLGNEDVVVVPVPSIPSEFKYESAEFRRVSHEFVNAVWMIHLAVRELRPDLEKKVDVQPQMIPSDKHQIIIAVDPNRPTLQK